jgi:RES domain-containing protein
MSERVTVWRICKETFAATAFSGEGARIYGGRFNSRGLPVAYAAGSLSLAMLETLVRVNRRQRLTGYVRLSATFDASHVEVADEDRLPVEWDARPYVQASQAFGDAWLAQKRSLVLRVPSAVEPVEHNFLINPLHPAFADALAVSDPEPLNPDPRLFGGEARGT